MSVKSVGVLAFLGSAGVAAGRTGPGDERQPLFSTKKKKHVPHYVKQQNWSKLRQSPRRLATVSLVSDFETGTPEGWEFYAVDGGGGIEVDNTNVPTDGGTYSLNGAYGPLAPDGDIGYWGGMIISFTDQEGNDANGGPISLVGIDNFEFEFDAQGAGSEFTLEIFMLDSDDSEDFSYDCVVGAAGSCAIIDSGWVKITIPIEDMVSTGLGDGTFTGPVGGIDFAVNSLSLTNVNYYTDNIAFVGEDPPTEAPVGATTDAPVATSTDAPVAAPGNSTDEPTEAPVAVAVPTEAPTVVVAVPTDAPVAGNVTEPTAAPVVVAVPTEAPIEVPEETTDAPTPVPAEDPIEPDASDPPTPEPVPDPTEAPMAAPVTPEPSAPPITGEPTTAQPTTRAPVVDDGLIECPKAFDETCSMEDGDLNCCLPSGKDGLGSEPLYRINAGEKLQAGEWLCREEYYFGLLHTGSIHTLKREEDGRCAVLWTAEEEMPGTNETESTAVAVEGDFLEVTAKGNIGLYEVGGSNTPIWKVGCSMGKDSRIQMVIVRDDKPEARMVLLRSFHSKRRLFNRRRKLNNKKKKKKSKRKMDRDWWVTIQADEEERDC